MPPLDRLPRRTPPPPDRQAVQAAAQGRVLDRGRPQHLTHDPCRPTRTWCGTVPIPFAHRGGTSDYPENTAPAFEHAVALGYRYLETDVHLTADGVLVAFHDNDLLRTCGHRGEIIAMRWDEIAALRVDGREPIPLMRDLFERWPEVRFNIDCKADAAVEALAQLVEKTGAIDRVCIGAFSHRRLQRLRRRLGPRLLTALSPSEVAHCGWPGDSRVLRTRRPGADVDGPGGQPPPRHRRDAVLRPPRP